jgi:hypothetical protein
MFCVEGFSSGGNADVYKHILTIDGEVFGADSERPPLQTPEPEPDPTPVPTPEPTPEPAPEPTPDPTPEPTPSPEPDNASDDEPDSNLTLIILCVGGGVAVLAVAVFFLIRAKRSKG